MDEWQINIDIKMAQWIGDNIALILMGRNRYAEMETPTGVYRMQRVSPSKEYKGVIQLSYHPR